MVTTSQVLKTSCSGHYLPLLLVPEEGLGALRAPRAIQALLGAFGPLPSSSIQKFTLRRLLGHLILQNPLRFFLSHFIWLPQEAYWEVREGAEGPLSWVIWVWGPKGPPTLWRSKKEGGHRPTEPSCSKNCKNCCHSFNCGQIKPEGIFRVFRGLYWKFWNDSLKQNIHMLL